MKSTPAFLTLTLAFAVAGQLCSQTNPACNADSAEVEHFRIWAFSKATGSATNANEISFVRSLLRLPPTGLDSAEVSLVTDEETCQQARNALAQVQGTAPQSLSLVVVRAGAWYLVSDPTQKSGEWLRATSFDSNFVYQGGVLY